ncbi:Tim44 domain-containing protein [Candidatus Electronema sp. JC]|uniref:Tim44 domain-containing protein n=1 Tax=Candidatus Electronema sp. JC TaxID=3401570 RepID=UPI003B43ABAB
MYAALRKLTPFFLVFFTLAFADVGLAVLDAEARSRSGGRSFKRSAPSAPRSAPASGATARPSNSGFGRGLAGGLIGGALGGLLLGSLFGANGSGIGILPILLLGVAGYFFYRRFMMAKPSSGLSAYQPLSSFSRSAPPPPPHTDPLEDGLAELRSADPDFDPQHFTEVASDVFFKVQAGWMRRDLSSFRHLLGSSLAEEYGQHFADMTQKGIINKLESISVRKAKIVEAGSVNGEDFVTLLFTANLLDYTVDEKSGQVLEGSMTEPVKFAEKWTWARPVNTEAWLLEGVELAD